jgi:Raf kinase inhibitor-like YbhB/YbcL family protein
MVAGSLALWSMGCTPRQAASSEDLPAPQTMKLESSIFSANGLIPAKYTCDGADVSPALRWSEPPENTRRFVLIVDDPDAPGKPFVHWLLYDLPSELRQLPEALPTDPILLTGGVQGKNDFDRYGYRGPCPPGGTHRYVFKLYAIDTAIDLPPGANKADVIAAMQGHVLAGATLVGRYRR